MNDSFVIKRTATVITRKPRILPFLPPVYKSQEVPIHDEMDANRGLVLKVVYENDREEITPCGRVLKSEQVVKIILKGGLLWSDIKEEREIKLCGVILQGVKSFSFEIDTEKNERWSVVRPEHLKSYWHESSEGSQQCEFMWIENDGIDSTTRRIILRAERVGENVIVYSFLLP